MGSVIVQFPAVRISVYDFKFVNTKPVSIQTIIISYVVISNLYKFTHGIITDALLGKGSIIIIHAFVPPKPQSCKYHHKADDQELSIAFHFVTFPS